MAIDGWSGFYGSLAAGVAGIAGTIAGVVLDRHLRRRGRVHVVPVNWSLQFYTLTELGDREERTMTNATAAEYEVAVDVYNSRDEPAGFRAVRVEFSRAGSEILSYFPEDLEARRSSGHFVITQELELLNLPPKHWRRCRLAGRIERDQFEKLRTSDAAHLVAEAPGGASHRYLLARLTW